jgi:ATP/maltotriose-dependent transcriptional regulator MalT
MTKSLAPSSAHAAAGSSRLNRLDVDALIDASYAKLGTDPQASVRLAKSALRRADRLRYVTGVARSHLRAGQGHWQIGEYAVALQQFEQGLINARRARDRATEAMCFNGMGVSHDRLGQYEPALACFERFVELSQARKDLRAFVMATVNVGHVLERTEQWDEAARRYRGALEVVGDSSLPGVSMLWMNFGVCLSLLGQYPESMHHLDRALAAFVDEQRPLDALLCRLNMAETAFHLDNDARSAALLREARAESIRLSAVHLEWRTHLIEGVLHGKRGQHALATVALSRALPFSARCNEPDLLRMTHQELSQAYEGLGDAALALHHYKLAAELQLRAVKALAHANAQQALESSVRETAALLNGQRSTRTVHRSATAPRKRTSPPSALSAREQDVLQGLARGLSNRAIGQELGISTFTARYHVSSIFNKLGVDTRGAAVTTALSAGLVTLEPTP